MSHKPKLLLDVARCKRNIDRIVQKADTLGLTFRPHFKTHQSIEIGRWFRDKDVSGITVSSVEMAAYFAKDNWKDITIAFPFYRGMSEGLKKLQQTCSIRLFVSRPEDIEFLNRELEDEFRVYIEIDAGYGRSGIHIDDKQNIDLLRKSIRRGEKSQFHGFYIHDGGTYRARGKKQIKERISDSMNALRELKNIYPDASTSLGDTPSASILENFDGIDEITPGNLVFYDWMQVRIGSCSLDDVAVYADLPFAQEIANNRAIVHGGAVQMSKDYILNGDQKTYGQAVQFRNNTVEAVDHCFLSALSQEHGTLSGFRPSALGENGNVRICPIHSCLTANLFDSYYTFEGEKIEKRILS